MRFAMACASQRPALLGNIWFSGDLLKIPASYTAVSGVQQTGSERPRAATQPANQGPVNVLDAFKAVKGPASQPIPVHQQPALAHSPTGAALGLQGSGMSTNRRVFASIDLGSSSVKLLVMAQNAAGALHVVEDRRVGANLGRQLAADGALPQSNQDRTLAALSELVAVAQARGVAPSDIPVIATAAVRNAPNGDAFVERMKTAVGLTDTRVLTGQQEAQTGYLAALAGISTQPTGRYVTLDLGGGSFQLAVGNPAQMERGGSTQVGSNRVQTLLPPGAISNAEFAAADRKLAQLAPMPLPVEAASGRTLAAVGGISLFLKTHFGRSDIGLSQIAALREQLGNLPPQDRIARLLENRTDAERMALGADTPERALDVAQKVPAKLTLLLHIMRTCGLETLHVSQADARHLLIHQAAAAATPSAPSAG